MTSEATPGDAALERTLLEIERALWTGGPDAYAAHTADNCLVVFAQMAQVMTRAAIARTAEQGRWSDVTLRPRGLVRLSADAVVIAYECTATRKDGRAHHAHVSSGYASGAGGWMLAFHQQTAIEDAGKNGAAGGN